MNPLDQLTRTTVYLPDRLRGRLRELAAERGVSEAQVIRESLESAVGRSRGRPDGGFLRETGDGA